MSSGGYGKMGVEFLSGGGETGAMMRALDWSATPLGPPEHWPQSLKTTVRIMLTSRQPIWVGWGDGLTYLYNDAYRSIVGGKHPWALGRPIGLVWREIFDEIAPLLDAVMRGDAGIYVEEQLFIMERNGYPEETYYTFSYSPIPGDDGAPGGIICANTDDTRRVIGERQLALLRDLATSTARARDWREVCRLGVAALAVEDRDLPFALLYATPDGDDDGLHLIAATGIDAGHPHAPARIGVAGDTPWPVAAALAGRAAVTVEGAALPAGEPVVAARWNRPVARAVVYPVTADGGRPAVLVAGLSPVRAFDEGYRGFIDLLAGQFATAIAAAEAYERERRRAEALAELDRAKTLFFSNVSHEFRTPLTLMLGPLEEMRDDPQAGVDAAGRALVDVAHRNGMRLMRLVNALLDFSRIEAGRMQAAYVATDLGRLTGELASGFRSACERAGLTLDVDAPSSARPAFVDRAMWETIVLNLLSNAFKFTLSGGITVRLRDRDDGFRLTVADTGTGIPADEMPRLFERFHRVLGQQGRSFEGSGIGLALVQELVRLHGGTVTAESELGRGTTFHVDLPGGSAHLPPEHVRADPLPAAGASRTAAFVDEALRWLPGDPAVGEATSPVGGDAGRVLLADDNGDMRDYVTRLLTAQGFAVEAVADGAAALAAARATPPDLLLTDVMMPVMDGFALLQAIRADPVLVDLPVVMLSARAGEEAEVEGLAAGADDYLAKPFSARELIARVTANLTTARVRREAAAAIRASQDYMRLLIDSTGEAFFAVDRAGRTTLCNRTFVRMLGFRDEVSAIGVYSHDLIHHSHPDGSPYHRDDCPIHRCASDGVAAHVTDERFFRLDGTSFPVEYRVQPIRRDGALQGALCTFVDVTERRRAEQALADKTRTLATLNHTLTALAAELAQDRVIQMVIDAGVELSGAEIGAFFRSTPDEPLTGYTLEALTGRDRAAFRGFPLPRDKSILDGISVVRSADVPADPRWLAPTPEMPMDDIRSFLGVPVTSRSGRLIGGLVFTHPEPDRFDERHAALIAGLAGQAAIAIDNARLFEASQREVGQRREAQAELTALNATLEQRVAEEVERRGEAEQALRQAQKMEAVGQLTGGIAHDFNNLLTIVTGNIDMAGRALDKAGVADARARRALDNAMRGAERAASLTQRLLAFSRRQPLSPRPTDIGRLVRGMSDMLHRALGETVALEITSMPGLWRVEVDANQLESAILNLAVNGRDAMPGGGRLTIDAANARLDDGDAATQAGLPPGDYALIRVIDSGSGMSRETVTRVFEPFFTTKDVGKGTGLGLSMVYGFVRQSGGHVKIRSEEGQGTTVKIYLPRLADDVAEEESGEPEPVPGVAAGAGHEAILVVEDDDDVRAYTVGCLRELGYRVVEAHDGPAALRLLERQAEAPDLMFTDVVMPGMSGRDLAAIAQARLPGLRVLYTSGYTRDEIVHDGRLDPGVEMLAKPFTFAALARRVREVLDA